MRLFRVLAGLMLLPIAFAPGRTAAAQPQVPPTSIDVTGHRDATEALGRFFASVADGSTVALPPKARYRIEGTLTLTGHHRLTIQGNDATLFALTPGDRNRSHLKLVGGSELAIRNLNIVGANPNAGVGDDAYVVAKEAQHGIELDGVTQVELDRVSVSDTFGDTVYIGPSSDRTWSSKVWIHDSRLVRTGRQGISITAGRDVVIERNTIQSTRRSTMDLEPNTGKQGASNIYFLNNRIGPGRLLFVAAHGGGPVDNIVIANNFLQGHAMSMSVQPPPNRRRSHWYVTGNRSTTPADRTPMTFVNVDGVVVRDNHQLVSRLGQFGVEARHVCSLVVTSNHFGPNVVALKREDPPCGPSPAPNPPPAPAIMGRAAGTPPPASTQSPTTVPTTTTGAPAGDKAVDHKTSSDYSAWVLVAAIGVLIAAGFGTVWAVRRRSPVTPPADDPSPEEVFVDRG